MVSFMFGQSLITLAQNGPSEKEQSKQLLKPSMLPSTQYKQELNFTERMDSFLTLLSSKAKEDLEIAAAQKALAEAQAITAQNMNLPHRIFAQSLKHDGLEWVCSYGSDENGNPFLVGRGSCPSEAFTDFDYKWLGIEKE